MGILIAIAEVVPKEQQSSHGVLLTALRSLIDDKSWRVRYMVADRFEKIAKAVDDEVVTRDLVPAFVKLLKDSEAEVRTAIAGQIPGFCKLIDRTILLNDVMTTVEDLVSDTSQHVRAARSQALIQERILPNLEKLQKDDDVDVRFFATTAASLIEGEPMNTSP